MTDHCEIACQLIATAHRFTNAWLFSVDLGLAFRKLTRRFRLTGMLAKESLRDVRTYFDSLGHVGTMRADKLAEHMLEVYMEV